MRRRRDPSVAPPSSSAAPPSCLGSRGAVGPHTAFGVPHCIPFIVPLHCTSWHCSAVPWRRGRSSPFGARGSGEGRRAAAAAPRAARRRPRAPRRSARAASTTRRRRTHSAVSFGVASRFEQKIDPLTRRGVTRDRASARSAARSAGAIAPTADGARTKSFRGGDHNHPNTVSAVEKRRHWGGRLVVVARRDEFVGEGRWEKGGGRGVSREERDAALGWDRRIERPKRADRTMEQRARGEGGGRDEARRKAERRTHTCCNTSAADTERLSESCRRDATRACTQGFGSWLTHSERNGTRGRQAPRAAHECHHREAVARSFLSDRSLLDDRCCDLPRSRGAAGRRGGRRPRGTRRSRPPPSARPHRAARHAPRDRRRRATQPHV